MEKEPFESQNSIENPAETETKESFIQEIGRLNAENGQLKTENNQLKTDKERLAEENKRLNKLATKDLLTGVDNRHGFLEKINGIIDKTWPPEPERRDPEQKHEPGAVLIIDIDDFKKINDTYGHAAGDEVLRQIAEELQKITRGNNDIVARWGGEEFVIFFQDTDAEKVIEKFYDEETGQAQKIFYAAVGEEKSPLLITLSGGVTDIIEGKNIEEIIDMADKLLYRAKEEGKNRIYRTEKMNNN